ncbi:hypothetical protein ABIA35_008195 [Catenulispora sp. MAP12-49]|uniref:hypothetical protein n=1 Tax=Catenulispora sp. MAP12-49 TaxID=3156302 RepID=UPI0035173F51
MVAGDWSVHPDFWVCRPGVNYVVAYARARWLASLLLGLAGLEVASEDLRLAAALYGPGWAVRADGTAVAWIGPGPDEAELWAELGADEPLPVGFGGFAEAA